MSFRNLHIAVFTLLLAACNGAAPNGRASGGSDSTDVNWHDSCMAAYLHIQDHYFAGQYDSMMVEAPAVMEQCRKHEEWIIYYNAWERLAERLVWEQEYERVAAEAEAMRTDAVGRLAIQGICSGGELSAVSSMVPTVTFSRNSGGFLSTDYVASNGLSITAPTLEIVNYYDSYAFLTGSMSSRFSPIATQNGTCVKGLITGCMTAISSGGFVCSLNLYDERGRLVETRNTRPETSLTETQTTTYTLTDNPQSAEYRLSRSGQGIAFIAHTSNTYFVANDKLHTTSLQVGINNSQPTSSRTIQTIAYNDLGQISSIIRPNGAGTVNYEYDLHGWLTNINTPSFMEELYYASDGNCSGTPCYNGNISVQKWSNSNYAQKRGYKFTYDTQNRLTKGIYGERDGLNNHKNDFNEEILEYYRSGAIKRLQRRGRKNDGVYGKIDNLHITVKGNRLHYVSDDAEKPLYDGAFDFNGDGANASAYQYNANGSLITDTGKGIMFIEYDNNGMPRRIQFADGNVTEYVYTATGQKLRTIYYTAIPGITVGSGETHHLTDAEVLSKDSIDYLGSLIMENGVPAQYLFPRGYCSLRGSSGNASVAWHYYNQDHLGNNREVISESGVLEQVTHYYPFGAPFCERTTAGANTNATLQRYKYNGKELDLMHGLKWYDYGARMYDPTLLTWNAIDPLCEEYYPISPYVYCKDNPVKNIDLDGRKVYVFAMKLPSPHSAVRNSGATHTFTVVKTSDGKIYRYAYGPTDDKVIHSISGTTNIVERNYNQDGNAVKNYFKTGKEDENTKNVVPVNIPEGMSEEAFDNAVINSAKQFRGNKTIKYRIIPLGETEGNCNSSTTSLLKNAGVNDIEIDRIGSEVSGIDTGFGNVKPWTEEQRKAAETRQEERRKMDESLSNQIGF